MPHPVKAYRSPFASVHKVLAALKAARTSLDVLNDAGARCEVSESGYARLFLPADPGKGPWGTAEDYERQAKELMAAFTYEAEVFDLRQGARSVNLEDYPTLETGALLVLLSCNGVTDAGVAVPTGSEKLILLTDGSIEDRLLQATDIVKRCSMVRLGAVEDGLNEDRTCLLLHVQDDVKRNSALAGLLARDEVPTYDVLSRYDTPSGPIFLPHELEFARSQIVDVGLVLREMRDAHPDEISRAYCVARVEANSWVFRTDLPTQDARDYVPDDIAAESASWRFFDLKQSNEAEGRLRDAIRDVDGNAGYRLSLHDIGTHIDDGQNLARIRERISDLEAQAALIQGLRAPQLVLLRFTRAQLPALADFLSSVPVADIDTGTILYGFQATADDPGGVHFLLYDPAEVQLDRSFLEWTWRERSLDQPIQYWIDPHWANFYTKSGLKVSSRVFTPKNTILHPTLHSFEPEEMDGYIRGLIRRRVSLSDHNTEVNELLSDSQRALGLVIGKSRDVAFEIAVEILDLDQFVPLRQRLDWINDNLLMVDPAFVSEERMSAIAAALFEGRHAAELLLEVDARAKGLDELAARSEERFAASIEALAQRFADEFSATIDHTDGMINLIGRLTARVNALETILMDVHSLSSSSEASGEALIALAADMELRRETLEEDIRGRRRETIEFVEVAEERLKDSQRALADLQKAIQQERENV